MLLVLIVRVPTRWTRTVTLFPCTTRFRSLRAFLGRLLAEFANATGGREGSLLRVEFLARRIAGDLHQLPALGQRGIGIGQDALLRTEEHTAELQSLMRNSYAVICLKKKKPAYSPSHDETEPDDGGQV